MNLFQQAMFRDKVISRNENYKAVDTGNIMCERGITGVKARSLAHGQKWRNHKYLYIDGNGNYVYPEDVAQKAKDGASKAGKRVSEAASRAGQRVSDAAKNVYNDREIYKNAAKEMGKDYGRKAGEYARRAGEYVKSDEFKEGAKKVGKTILRSTKGGKYLYNALQTGEYVKDKKDGNEEEIASTRGPVSNHNRPKGRKKVSSGSMEVKKREKASGIDGVGKTREDPAVRMRRKRRKTQQ